ncbi:MAG: C25 family peptidase propeptide domain-containing protein [Bacteroidales bacterium]|nr:C25 family peptidase propeptide domain-containing protein [Bacteroidales bacterium]
MKRMHFYPADHAILRTPYILRDYRGQTIVVNPFRYNPVTKELRVAYRNRSEDHFYRQHGRKCL